MILDECVISKYGKSCISSNRMTGGFSINNLLLYLLIRNIENVFNKYISNIKNCDIDLNDIIFS